MRARLAPSTQGGAMRKRRMLLIAAITLTVPVAWLAWCLFRPGVDLSREACSQIALGMTMAEVEAIIGGPPGRYGGAGPRGYFARRGTGTLAGTAILNRQLDGLRDAEFADDGRFAFWSGPRSGISVVAD